MFHRTHNHHTRNHPTHNRRINNHHIHHHRTRRHARRIHALMVVNARHLEAHTIAYAHRDTLVKHAIHTFQL